MNEGFLDHFVAQFEKVGKRIASSEEEVLEAIASIKKATADTKKREHETELSLPGPGIAAPKKWHIIYSRD